MEGAFRLFANLHFALSFLESWRDLIKGKTAPLWLKNVSNQGGPRGKFEGFFFSKTKPFKNPSRHFLKGTEKKYTLATNIRVCILLC